jgi:hypothetical protein
MSSVVATPMIQQHEIKLPERSMPLTPRMSETDDNHSPVPRISQSIAPGTRIDAPKSRIVYLKLASRKASTWKTNVISFLTRGILGFVGGNYSHETAIGSKIFPITKNAGIWIRSSTATCATSIFQRLQHTHSLLEDA